MKEPNPFLTIAVCVLLGTFLGALGIGIQVRHLNERVDRLEKAAPVLLHKDLFPWKR